MKNYVFDAFAKDGMYLGSIECCATSIKSARKLAQDQFGGNVRIICNRTDTKKANP